jgi:uncharacterized membrane protein
MKMIAGLFDTFEDTERAVNEMQNLGISRERIGVLARDAVLRDRIVGDSDPEAESAGAGAVGGTALGGLGGLLVGLSSITIPGLGPVITAGTIITALGTTAAGAGIGAATGGILGALAGAGISEADAQVYAESVRRGSLLLTVEVDDSMSPLVMEVLDRANAVDISARREELHRSGWQRFDDASAPDPGDIRYGGIRASR